MVEQTTQQRGILGWRALTAITVLVALLLAGAHQGLRLLAEHRADSAVFTVILDGDSLHLDGAQLRELNAELDQLGERRRREVVSELTDWADRWVDDTYGVALDGLSAYMDWYYSMPGSYTRLFYAATGGLDELLAERLRRELFEHSGFEEKFAELDAEFSDELYARLQGGGTDLGRELAQRYRDRQVEPPADGETPVINLDGALSEAFSAGPDDIRRLRGAAAGGAGAGALALLGTRALLPRLLTLSSVQGARRLTAGFAARIAPRLAGAAATGGSAATATAYTGPGALVTGTIAFTVAAATLVGTDYGLLKVEEKLQREDKEDELRGELIASREAARAQLHARVEQVVAVRRAEQRRQLNEPFRILD